MPPILKACLSVLGYLDAALGYIATSTTKPQNFTL